jgi:ABC-type Zn uptake system ZnuABC Zn-binding protein ZnuA
MQVTAPLRALGLQLVILTVALLAPRDAPAQQKVRVVASLPTYAALAREIAGDLAEVESIARGDVDPHFVQPRPSFAAMIQKADLFISTGLDLELWVPTLLDRANNTRVVEGAPGNIVAYSGVRLQDIPENVSRTGGDVHVFGNPHIHTDPINSIIVARNIAAGFKRVDAENAANYDTNLTDFEHRLMVRLFGEELVEIMGEDVLFDLAAGGRFWSFAENQELGGKPLLDYLGGWLLEAAPFRDQRIVCYHKNWIYFSTRFRVECAIYVEPKPGIPASPGHVRDVIDFIRDNDIAAILAANYYSSNQVEQVASRTGAAGVRVPFHEEGEENVNDYFTLIDTWVSRLAQAFREQASGDGE